MKVISRYYLHLRRYYLLVLIPALFFGLMFLSIMVLYPGEETLESYISLSEEGTFKAVLGTLDVENPGFFFWVTLYSSMMLVMYIPIAGIFLGGNILPLKEKEGKEIIFTTPQSVRNHFLENSLLTFVLLWAIVIPAYLITVVSIYVYDAMDTLENVTIGFVIAIFLSTVFVYLTAFGSTLTFSKNTGYLLGGGFLIFSFIGQMLANSQENDFYGELSLFYRAKGFQNSFKGVWDLEFFALCCLLSFLLIMGSFLILSSSDYVAKDLPIFRDSPDSEKTMKGQGLIRKITNNVQKPVQTVLGKIGWRYPAIRDQFHSNALIFAACALFTTFITVIVVLNYPGEADTEELVSGFQHPIFTASMFGRDLHGDLESFLSYEIFAFGWTFFGIFLLIAVNNLINRDYKQYADITWQLPRTPSEVIFKRTIAAVIYYGLIFALNLIGLVIALLIMNYEVNMTNVILAFVLAAWAYCIIMVFFIAVSLIPSFKHTQKVLFVGYGLAVLILFVAFMLDASWLRYLSPFGYFDIVGVLLGDIEASTVLIEGLIFTTIAIAFYIIILRVRLPTKDLV